MGKIAFFIIILFLSLVFPQNIFAADTLTINEIIVHPSSENSEFVEFYNPNNIDLKTYFIDDDTNFTDDIGSSKKSLTGVVDGEIYDYIELSNFFNNPGDHVVLFDSSGNIIDQYEYTSDPGTDAILGRNPNGTGQFISLITKTPGAENSGSLPTPTLTPTKIPTPTKVPTPTRTPTPTKVPTPTQTKVPSPTHSASSGQAKIPTPVKSTPTKSVSLAITKNNQEDFSQNEIASADALPTAILGASVSATPTKVIENKKKTMVNGATKNNAFNGLFFIIGSVFLVSCGILILRRKNQI